MLNKTFLKPTAHLANELLHIIFRHLSLLDLLNVSKVNRQWRTAANDDSLWRSHAKKYLKNNNYQEDIIEKSNNIGPIKLLLRNSLFTKKHIKLQQQITNNLINEYRSKLLAIRRDQDEYHEELMSQSQSSHNYYPFAAPEPSTVIKGYACFYMVFIMLYRALKEEYYIRRLRGAEIEQQNVINSIERNNSPSLESIMPSFSKGY